MPDVRKLLRQPSFNASAMSEVQRDHNGPLYKECRFQAEEMLIELALLVISME